MSSGEGDSVNEVKQGKKNCTLHLPHIPPAITLGGAKDFSQQHSRVLAHTAGRNMVGFSLSGIQNTNGRGFYFGK